VRKERAVTEEETDMTTTGSDPVRHLGGYRLPTHDEDDTIPPGRWLRADCEPHVRETVLVGLTDPEEGLLWRVWGTSADVPTVADLRDDRGCQHAMFEAEEEDR
jgi:hypothetical protein